ncbi:MAG: hypothetical protein LC792_02375 [Actinobacteria bacterium]|nr:hypothetical protein [Actinomycetota bacterium]
MAPAATLCRKPGTGVSTFPEARINCYAYCWVHPNLGVVTAGLFIYQGIAAELFDMPAFLSAETVFDGSDIRVPNGLRRRVIDPLNHIHMTFSDPVRETEVDVHLTAVDAPIGRANGKHFEQVMRTLGHLVLRGRRYDVDSLNVRDRSWGELRPEDHNPAPPYNWVTGVFEDGALAFNVGSLDDPAQKPHWLEHYPVAADKAFKDGWIRRDGRTIRLVHASKRVEREPGSLRPTHIAIELHDAEGEVFEVTGEIVAGLPWGGWHNMNCHLALVRWELEGRVGRQHGCPVERLRLAPRPGVRSPQARVEELTALQTKADENVIPYRTVQPERVRARRVGVLVGGLVVVVVDGAAGGSAVKSALRAASWAADGLPAIWELKLPSPNSQ